MFNEEHLKLYNIDEINALIKCLDKEIEKYEGFIDVFEDTRDSLVRFKRDNNLYN